MPQVLRSSLEHRIIEHASRHYPLTAEGLAGALGVPVGRVMLELRRMESKGMVELDVLPDKVFVRLLVATGDGERDRGNREKRNGGGDDPAYS